MTGDRAGVAGRTLIGVGEVAMRLEPYYPGFVRRNLGVRLFLQAAMVLVVAPLAGIVLFDSVIRAAVLFVAVTLGTGFLAYCELYLLIVRLTEETEAVADGQFAVGFEIDRRDEIGTLLRSFTSMVGSLEASVAEAEAATEEAREQREASEERSATLLARAETYSEAFERAAAGDLTVRIDPETDEEALRRIGESFDAMMEELATTISRVDHAASAIAAASDRAADGVSEAETAAEEVATATATISDGTDEQSDRLAEATEETADLSAAVEEVASTADEIAERADDAARRGQDGMRVAETAAAEMERIAEGSAETERTIEALAADLDRVEEIVDLIDGIAEQTNTLALNASIEAARAEGEAGDGFAVVASEVKSLAEETQEATRRIADLVADVQASMDETAASVAETRDRVDRGTEAVENAAEVLASIVDSIEETNDAIASIAAATDEQATGAQQVASLAESVASVADQTAREAETAATATREQTETLDAVADDVTDLADRAAELDRLTDEFRTGDRTTHDAGREAVAADGGHEE